MIELDRSACGFPTDADEHCSAPPVDTVTLRLPAEPIPGILIAEDQRTVRMGICADHLAIAGDSRLIISGAPTHSRYGDVSDAVPPGHARHRVPTAGCLGCDLDFGPAHTRVVPHG